MICAVQQIAADSRHREGNRPLRSNPSIPRAGVPSLLLMTGESHKEFSRVDTAKFLMTGESHKEFSRVDTARTRGFLFGPLFPGGPDAVDLVEFRRTSGPPKR